ncbi:MAG TPA: hypothetical protein VFE32_02845 [Puia sp.]|nr:hypothetical protein [Puia sp.]
MGTLSFATTFSGGKGSLNLTSYDIGTTLSFTQATRQPKTMNLPMGNHIFSVTGSAPNGTGGGRQALPASSPSRASEGTLHLLRIRQPSEGYPIFLEKGAGGFFKGVDLKSVLTI